MRFFSRTTVPEEASSKTPLHDSYGIITPSSLHFERHHGGVPDIDPAAHTLTIHGLVDRPLVFTIDELKRLPSVSRIMFLECSGNGNSEWKGAGEPTVQRTHGLTSYDAAYLDLALRRQLPIASLDDELRQAAVRLGVELSGK